MNISHSKAVRLVTSRCFHRYMVAWMIAGVMVLGVIAGTAVRVWAQEPAQPTTEQKPKIHIDWQNGPTTCKLGDIAEITIPEAYKFTDKSGTEKLLQLTHNIASGHELGAIVADQGDWFMIFEFENSGYVKDDEGGKLDADAILKSLKEGTDESNAERAKHGWRPTHVPGGKKQPFDDPKTPNLT